MQTRRDVAIFVACPFVFASPSLAELASRRLKRANTFFLLLIFLPIPCFLVARHQGLGHSKQLYRERKLESHCSCWGKYASSEKTWKKTLGLHLRLIHGTKILGTLCFCWYGKYLHGVCVYYMLIYVYTHICMSVYAYIKVHFLTLLLVYVVDIYFPYNTYFFVHYFYCILLC